VSLIGKKLWQYRLEGVLGEGGTATVYRAVDEKEKRSVAVKILPKDIDRSVIQRFKQEIKVLSQLDHPNIIRIFDVGSAEGLCFYVMENRPSRTLRELMDERFRKKRTGFTLHELMTAARQVGDALRCAHDKGIYHRDIKPSNILVTPDFQCILCDFGLAKISADKTFTQAGTLMGTPLYMSPEQIQGGDVDHRSDLYQLGLVLYQMATGIIPFAGENPYVAATRRLSEAIPAPTGLRPDLPGNVEQVILRCLERERLKRYPSANELLAELDRVSSTNLKSASRLEHTVLRLPRKQSWRAAAAVGVALLAAAGLGAWYWTVSRPTELRVTAFTLVPGRDEVMLSFETDPPLGAEVIYGDGPELDRRKVISEVPSSTHRASLTKLTPGHVYHYQLRLNLEPDRVKTLPVREFTTTEGP
jgi:serine/threonine protein kinase